MPVLVKVCLSLIFFYKRLDVSKDTFGNESIKKNMVSEWEICD